MQNIVPVGDWLKGQLSQNDHENTCFIFFLKQTRFSSPTFHAISGIPFWLGGLLLAHIFMLLTAELFFTPISNRVHGVPIPCALTGCSLEQDSIFHCLSPLLNFLTTLLEESLTTVSSSISEQIMSTLFE